MYMHLQFTADRTRTESLYPISNTYMYIYIIILEGRGDDTCSRYMYMYV